MAAAPSPGLPCRADGGDSLLVGREGGLQGATALCPRAERPARVPCMVDASFAPAVAILTRAPSSGGKTRLFASLGRSPDPALLSALLLDTVDGVAAEGVRRVIAVTRSEERRVGKECRSWWAP